MTKWLAFLCTCLALGVGAVGCGGGKDNGGGNGGGGKATSAPKSTDTGGGGGGGGKTASVAMKNIAFNPKSLSVAKGTTVKWTNDDSVNHDVTKTGGPGPKFASGSGNIAKGDTFEQTFDTAGKVDYVCTVHPNMTASITVK
jgi:plastocyanin